MSDNIVINITPTQPDPINVNVSTSPENISVAGTLYGVISVNGKTGVVLLTKEDIGLGNVDNTSDWLKPISYATLTALQSFSLVLASSSFWNSVYSTVNNNSANWNTAYNISTILQNSSSNWDFAYNTSTIVQNNSSFWGGSDQVFSAFLNYLSTTPLILSSTNTQGKILSGGVDLFDIFSTSFAGSQTLIYNPSSYNLTISNGNTVNLSSINATFASNSAKYESVYSSSSFSSGNWNSVYNTVQTTSALWNYQGTDIKALTANWESTYTTVQNVSANWNTDNSIDSGVRALSGNWESTYTTVQNTSAQWNTDNSIDLGVRALSGNWESTYSTVLNTSGLWNYQGTDIKALTANWENTYQVVQAGANNWYSASSSAFEASKLYSQNYYYPISGGVIKGPVTIEGNLYVLSSLYIAGTSVYVNAQDLIVKDPIIYIAEGNQTDILDIGIMASWTNPPGYPTGYQHGGLVRRSDNKIWTLFSGATSEPLSALNVEWYQQGIVLEPLSAKFYGDIYGNRTVYGALNVTESVRANSLTINGNISASGVLYGQAQDSTLSPTSTNTVQNSAVTAALQLLSPAPSYSSPSLSLTNFSPSTFELGATVSRSLTQNWTQNDAGPLTGSILRKGSSTVASYGSLPQTYVVSESAVLGTTTYQMSASYGSGLIKNNVLGFPDPRGQITAGSITTSQSYIGYYRRWIGSWPSIPSNANDIRTISLSSSLDTNTTLASVASPIYISNKFILIAIPNTRTLVSVITEANENLTSQFTLSSVQIQDASGTGRPYKLYYLETALPLNANLTTATIS